MPRLRRNLVEGGVYHIYNRFARDEEVFAVAVCRALGVQSRLLASHEKDRSTTRLRELVAAVGPERWGQSAGELGRVLGKHPDMVSRWARRAAIRRLENPSLAEQHEALGRKIAASNPEARGR